jgi:hypothetical protein
MSKLDLTKLHLSPIFIGGTGRSGTTILKRVLANHSKVVSLRDELRVIVDPGGALDLIASLSDRWSPYNADIAIQRFRDLLLQSGRARNRLSIIVEKSEKNIFRKLGLAPRRYLGQGFAYYFGKSYYLQRVEQLICDLSYHVTEGSWAGSPSFRKGRIYEAKPLPREEVEDIIACFFDDLYCQIADKGETHWIDDTPYNLLHANELFQLYPDNKFIHIYRDPRDVMASYRKFSWGGDSYRIIAQRLACIYDRWFSIREIISASCYLEVSLESLASDTHNVLGEICDFVGFPFEQDLLCLISLDKVNVGRWKKEVSQIDMESAIDYLLPYISSYGYSLE